MPASIMSSIITPSVMAQTFAAAPTTNLPKTLLTPSNIEQSILAYEKLLDEAKSYRNALAALSQSANAFGAALEECSRTKGLDEAAEGLSNVAGLQYLIANHQSVLSDTVYRTFEIPLRENLENFVVNTEQRREEYKMDLIRMTKLLAKREKEHLALAHKKQRSLNKFREALADLTKLADDIDQLKSDYFYNALDYHSETWNRVAVRSNILCKAKLSMYSGVAQKADHLEWSLVGTPDPWTQELRSGDELFSIVPPQEIMARPQSPSHDNSAVGLFQSLVGVVGPLDSPGPPTRTHSQGHPNGPEVREASFLSIRHEVKGVPAIKHAAISATIQDPWIEKELSDEDAQMTTPKAKTDKPASPYQDAEEEVEAATKGHGSESSPKRAVEAATNSCTPQACLDTPSRPVSKRANTRPEGLSRNSADRISARHMNIGTPRSLRTKPIVAHKSEGDVKTGDESPESEGGWKHSQFANSLPRKIELEAE